MASQASANVSVNKETKQVTSYRIVIQDLWSRAGEPIKIPLPVNESGKALILVMYCNKTTHDVMCNINDNYQASSAADVAATLYPVVDRFLNLPITKTLVLNACGYTLLSPKEELRSKYCTSTGTVTIGVTPVNEYSAIATSTLRTGSLYLNPQHADVTLIVDGERLPAHKCILCSSSPVFQAMFQHPMKEAATNEVVICDHSAPAVKTMLHYIYTGTIPEEKDCQREAVPLLTLAAFYQINDLAMYLGQSIDIGLHNIKQLLQAVSVYGSEDGLLLDRAMQFVVHHANELMGQAAFLDGLDPEICHMMLKAMAGVPLRKRQRNE